MVFISDLHVHTRYCDGASTVLENAQAAVEKGFKSLGISGHGPAEYDDVGMSANCYSQYLQDIKNAQEEYRGRLDIYAGVELEAYSGLDTAGLDYVLCSVHYVRDSRGIYCIEGTIAELDAAIAAMGSVKKTVESYYYELANMAHTIKPDIIGHADIITKLNQRGEYFDEDSSWYLKLADNAARELAKSGCIVEINTGPLRKGHKSIYPSLFMLTRLREYGGRVIINSDAHLARDIGADFDKAEALIKEAGFSHVMQLYKNKFIEVSL